jgi:hypothetical protein
MRLFVFVLLVALVAALPRAEAQELAAGDRAAIEGVIRAQLDAFNRDDGELAYSFAAPGIQRLFPTVEIFMTMVREGYAPVYRSREAEFRDVRTLDADHFLQQVLIVGADGSVVLALYTMERIGGATWKIAGCILAKADEAGA